MTIFVSNPSRQAVVFYYRRTISRDTSGPAAIDIPSGGQVELGHGWSPEETAYVISQIIRAGGANAAEAHGKMGSFTGMLYRETNPVDVGEIVTAHESVMKHAEDRSVSNATRGALAFDRAANANKGQKTHGRLARVTEVEVIQELPPHQSRTGDEVAFKLSVDPEGRADVRLPV